MYALVLILNRTFDDLSHDRFRNDIISINLGPISRLKFATSYQVFDLTS